MLCLTALQLIAIGVGLFFLLRGQKSEDEGRYVLRRTTFFDGDGSIISIEEFSLDQHGFPTGSKTRDGDGNLIERAEFVCDANGNVLEETVFTVDENGTQQVDRREQNRYDGAGRLLESRYFDETGALRWEVTCRYDGEGRELECVGSGNNGDLPSAWRKTVYDDRGNPICKLGTDRKHWEFSSEELEIENEYDDQNRLVRAVVYTASDEGADRKPRYWSTFEYGSKGNLLREICYYDEYSIRSVIEYDGAGHEVRNVLYDYNGYEMQKYLYEYDSRGSLTKETFYSAGAKTYITQYEYERFD